jgi:NAD(P)-dependent dehydrogenase (short-subunit alcohol dehydrogenase family)
VRLFRARGANVVVVACGADAGERLLGELGAEHVASLAADATDSGTPAAAVARARERLGGLDVLVNNAGMDHVRVNSVAPGFAETPLMSAWLDDQSEPAEARRRAAAAIPQGRFATPRDVAYLASPDAAHVTGTSLAVDGGYTAQ